MIKNDFLTLKFDTLCAYYLQLLLSHFAVQETLDDATECWGIMVERVEMYV